ncbi:multidrug effflux MFS transporter [Neorhodopirellula lusitana]|uniref:multidrug effflux MFS transporter n=1 Tax=Neorhodopirellula lusitana TaxID=445327 RepID=UPI00384E98AA
MPHSAETLSHPLSEKPHKSHSKTPFIEYLALIASLMALVALSTDAMLPALTDIGIELKVMRENDVQMIVSLLFLGMAIGQMFLGPLSDTIGRKPTLCGGLALFITGSVLSLIADSFNVMLVGRFIQGLGVAGPRSVSVAMIRDQYEGRPMARVMSLVMTVFILVPVIAPALGQGILMVAHWRMIFAVFVLLAAAMFLWFVIRQPETLAPNDRTAFSGSRLWDVIREICTNRIAFGYTMVAGLISGAFLGFLSSASQIFQQQYGLRDQFPIYFAVLALASGTASFVNSGLVMRYGMHTLINRAMRGLAVSSIAFLAFAYSQSGTPALWTTMAYFLVAFFAVGILFGNLNALAMEPLGHVAGVGSAIVGSLSTLVAVPLSMAIGLSYDGTVLPLVGGYAILSACSLVIIRWAGDTSETIA